MYTPDFDIKVTDKNGKTVDIKLVSSPLFNKNKDDTATFLGSTFFITRNGLMLTAKHCLYDINNKSTANCPFIIQFLPNNKYLLRGIKHSLYNDTDIAILIPHNTTHNNTNEILTNPVLPLTSRRMFEGEKIASFAWPNSATKWKADMAHLIVGEKWHYGLIEDYHADGQSVLRNSCYQSCMHIEGGSSGGLVVNSDGHIFAINSTGADVIGMEPYSLLTPVVNCFNIPIKADDGTFTIKQLIELNKILFHGKLDDDGILYK
jgi:hypothetical protein